MGRQIPVGVSWTEKTEHYAVMMIDEEDVKAWLVEDEPVTPELVKEFLTDGHEPAGEPPAWFPKLFTYRPQSTEYTLNQIEVNDV